MVEENNNQTTDNTQNSEEEKQDEKTEVPAEENKKEEPVENKEEKVVEEKKKEKKEEKQVEVPKKFKKLIEEIENMKVADLAELVKVLEEKFGVSAVPQAVAAMPAATQSNGGEAGPSEKDSYNIELSAIGDKKIEVIKVVRDITQKGLKESKDLVDAAEKEPQIIRENVKKEEAEEIKKKFEAAGAKVELK